MSKSCICCGKPAQALLANRRPGGHFGIYPYGTAPPDAYCQVCLKDLAMAYRTGREATLEEACERGMTILHERISWLDKQPEEVTL